MSFQIFSIFYCFKSHISRLFSKSKLFLQSQWIRLGQSWLYYETLTLVNYPLTLTDVHSHWISGYVVIYLPIPSIPMRPGFMDARSAHHRHQLLQAPWQGRPAARVHWGQGQGHGGHADPPHDSTHGYPPSIPRRGSHHQQPGRHRLTHTGRHGSYSRNVSWCDGKILT